MPINSLDAYVMNALLLSPVDLRDDRIQNGLAVHGAGVEQDVEQGVVNKVAHLRDALQGVWLQAFVGPRILMRRCRLLIFITFLCYDLVGYTLYYLPMQGGVPVDRQELDPVGPSGQVSRLEVPLGQVGGQLPVAVHHLGDAAHADVADGPDAVDDEHQVVHARGLAVRDLREAVQAAVDHTGLLLRVLETKSRARFFFSKEKLYFLGKLESVILYCT